MAAKGTPKTGGRQKGTPNKATADVRALAQVHAPAAIAMLATLATEATSEQARVSAIKELLDRGFGKSPQAIVGQDGGPMQHQHLLMGGAEFEAIAKRIVGEF